MSVAQRITELPSNFDEYVAEVGEGIGGLYGTRAAQQYRVVAREVVQSSIEHPSVYAFGVREHDRTVGMLLSALRYGVGQISFIHVLRGHAGRGIEQRLVEACVKTFQDLGVDAITSECVAFCPLDLEDTYLGLGFDLVPRALMRAPLDAPGLLGAPSSASMVAPEDRYDEVAAIIVDAYRGHPGRGLHVEVRDPGTALDFVERVASGECGAVRPEYLRIVEREGRLVGAILGCEVAPDQGFVLQVAVRPAWQRRGIGTQLVQDLAQEFRRSYLSHVALGATLASPAFGLYQRLGFQVLRLVDAYVWWREGRMKG